MLNKVKSADIRRRLIEAAVKGSDLRTKISFEISRRENTVEGLGEQIVRERDEIEYLVSLDPVVLEKETANVRK